MSNTIIVYKGRTNIITVSLGMDVAGDTLTSEIRTAAGALIATWDVTFDADGHDGELILTLQETVTATIAYPTGLMDLKRVSGGEPLPVFDRPLEVEFRESVTA
jgi:hypothetical protein